MQCRLSRLPISRDARVSIFPVNSRIDTIHTYEFTCYCILFLLLHTYDTRNTRTRGNAISSRERDTGEIGLPLDLETILPSSIYLDRVNTKLHAGKHKTKGAIKTPEKAVNYTTVVCLNPGST